MATAVLEPQPACQHTDVDFGKPRPPGVDLDAWRGDLQRLHGTLDQVVQSFISSQTRQLDAIAAELASQQDRIVNKERCFNELSDSIAGFVEEEAKQLEVWGVPLVDVQVDEQREAYDAELPGPAALHRINRLWRKATRAFEAMREAKERESAAALEEQRQRLEGLTAEAESRCAEQQREHAAKVQALEGQLEALSGDGKDKETKVGQLAQQIDSLTQELEGAKKELAEASKRIEDGEVTRSRHEYEWDAEREELQRERSALQQRTEELDAALAEAAGRERELTQKCTDRATKLDQMKRMMDEQEREMTAKLERVEQYVKERQSGALHAERKQQDAEKMCERWQGEVRRLQAEKDRLAKLVLDLEGHKSGQASEIRGVLEQHQQEVGALQEALRRKEEEMRAANLELLRQRDDEYQQKVSVERQKEKDRSIALLKKKEQEVHIKDQQLKAAQRRLQELESGAGVRSSSPRSHTMSRRNLASDGSLPPLPLSAR
mmetsp:Transcript_41249/g.119264  ORF Transcript_41249/g.119264 Transcript_41249/m.119264 type:complete len:493 (-) Transcript_41249:204-1682(-)